MNSVTCISLVDRDWNWMCVWSIHLSIPEFSVSIQLLRRFNKPD